MVTSVAVDPRASIVTNRPFGRCRSREPAHGSAVSCLACPNIVMGGNATAAKTAAAPQKATRLLNLNMPEIVCGGEGRANTRVRKTGRKHAGSEEQDPAYVCSVVRVLFYRPALS